MTAPHTPGPWKVSTESADPDWAVVTTTHGNVVANVNSETGPDLTPLVSVKMPQNANARLIAAAPDLLASFRELASYLVMEHGVDWARHSEMMCRASAIALRIQGEIP